MAPTVMVLRLALKSPRNTVSSGTITHISAMYFDNSQQGNGGNRNGSSSSGETTSAEHVNGDAQDQTPIIYLTKESTMHNLIGLSPV